MILKILVVNWRDIKNPEAGGAEVHLHEIFGRIARGEDDVTVVTHAFAGAPQSETIDAIRVLRTGHKFDFNFRVRPFVRKLLARERFDVIVEDLNKLPFFLNSLKGPPTCAILHHFFGDSIWKETNPVFASYVGAGEWLVRTLYRKLPFNVVSESTAGELVDAGFSPENVSIVHNAVDHQLYSVDGAVPKVHGQIVYLGRVKKYKGIEFILRALPAVRERIPSATLVVVGGGDDHARLQKITLDLGLEAHVSFTGMVDTDEKIRILRESEVMVTPSPKEGWGVTTIEANACGTPVIASNVHGLRDAIRDGDTGILFPYGDVAALSQALIRVLGDDVFRDELRTNAIPWAARFRWDDSARGVRNWLADVVRKGKIA